MHNLYRIQTPLLIESVDAVASVSIFTYRMRKCLSFLPCYFLLLNPKFFTNNV